MERYLEHYGVKGMRWGVRRTPEQLGRRSSSRDRKLPIGYKPLKYDHGYGRTAAYAAKYIAVNVAAMFIPGFGVAYNLNAVRTMYNTSLDTGNYLKADGPVEKVSTLKKKDTDTSTIDDMRKVNPRGIDSAKKGTVNNCACCTIALEMRRRGYDVKARRSGAGYILDDVLPCFKNSKITPVSTIRDPSESVENYAKRGYANLCQAIEKDGAGARGLVSVQWKKGGGHAIFYEVDQFGDVSFYDGQVKQVNSASTFSLADPSKYSYIRMDNLETSDKVCEFVVSVDGRNKKDGDKK